MLKALKKYKAPYLFYSALFYPVFRIPAGSYHMDILHQFY